MDEYCFIARTGNFLCNTKEEWAAWVQAVGSVVALGLTGFLAVWEAKRSRRAESRRAADQFAAKVAIFRFAGEQLAYFLSRHRSDERKSIPQARGSYEGTLHALEQAKSVRVTDMPTESAVVSFFTVGGALTLFAELLRKNSPAWLGTADMDRFEVLLKSYLGAINALDLERARIARN